jgi:cytochrome oxidase assembly protein ShyY1
VYRFLVTPRWLGLCALMLAAATVMVGLGLWQLSRYHERSAINNRMDAGAHGAAAPLGDVVPQPGGTAGKAGPAPPVDTEWSRVTMTGRYDSSNEILVRGRTVNDTVGFEVVTPLVLADGSAVLVDRGWVPPAPGGAMAIPDAPAAPTGQISVAGQVHLTESRPGPIDRRDGRIEVRRVSVGQIAGRLPYPVYGAYVLMDKQTPPADAKLVSIPVEHELAWQNAGYVVQWWMFAGLTVVGLVWLIRRESREDGPSGPGNPGRDRAAERDRDRAADPAPALPFPSAVSPTA